MMFKKEIAYKKEIVHKNPLTFTKDKECELISKFSLYKCRFERDAKNNIIKFLPNNYMYNKEIKIYLYLLDKHITLLSTPSKSCLYYHIKDKISLYSFINQYKPNIKFVLNELFCFINKFISYKFVHGNLHIHNIFINPHTFMQKANFYIMDFSNSNILNAYTTKINCYKNDNRYTNDNCYKNDNLFFYNWDFFSLYISLKFFFKNDMKNLIYLENLIVNYINPINFKSLLNKYMECSVIYP